VGGRIPVAREAISVKRTPDRIYCNTEGLRSAEEILTDEIELSCSEIRSEVLETPVWFCAVGHVCCT
jgi:hypothetical protein